MPLLADIVEWLSRVLVGSVTETAVQLACLMLPLFGLALALHVLEWLVQSTLARRFGWNSVLATGWLGASVHELSHAALCPLFGHRIDELALFKPDKKSGRLGYVKHSYNPRNPWHVVGNFFIGVAPLLGGALVLYGLLWLFFPEAARHTASADGLGVSLASGHLGEAANAVLSLARDVIAHLFMQDNLLSWRLWLFLYLALCVGSHLAPSRSDYDGAKWGALLLVGLLWAFNLIFLACGGSAGWLVSNLAPFGGPLLALLSLCVVLCSAVTLVVWLAAQGIDLATGNKLL
jgi:hypothetical protein